MLSGANFINIASMPQRARQLHEDWKRADDLARDAEQHLSAQWEAYFRGDGPAPKQEALDLVKDMRAVASVRLAELMEYMRTSTQTK
jgi:hypothetical protein